MKRNFLISILLLSIVAISFNHCLIPDNSLISNKSAIDIGNPQSPLASGTRANGGGHPGMQQFSFFSQVPICRRASTDPDLQLEVNYATNQAFILDKFCAPSGGEKISFNEIFMTNFNPFIAYVSEKVFVDEFLHQNLNGIIAFRDFCYTVEPIDNLNSQLNFTVRYFRPVDANGQRGRVTTTGILIKSGPQIDPTPIFSDGTTYERLANQYGFRPNDNSYEIEVDYSFESLDTPGRITLPDGRTINMNCRHNFMSQDP